MNRIDRLNAVLIHLQGKPRVTIEELEERFNVSRRTLFRDIRSLTEAGVPIGGDAGEGYFVVEGYHLPPVVFNQEEASAILLGSKFIEKHTDIQTAANFKNAMFKIKAVLRYHDKAYLESLEDSISVLGSPILAGTELPNSHIAEIQQALAANKVIQITYFSNYSEETTEREVEPLGLVYYNNRWHLIGYCRLREDLRDFRTDRIHKIKVLSVSYDPTNHPNFRDFTYGMSSGTDALEAKVKFTKKVSRFIQEQKYHYGFVSEEKTGEHVLMEFLTPHYGYFGRWLMMFGDQVEVLGPEQLKGKIAAISRDTFNHHKKYFEIVNQE